MRVAICQLVLPAYRLPVFQRLAGSPGTELTVFADAGRGSIKTVDPSGPFRFILAKVHHWRVLGREFRFQPVHLTVADSQRFDVLVLSWDIHYLSLVPALLLARLRGVPTILWGHGFSQRPAHLTEAVRNAVGKLADAILVYNHSTARRLMKTFRPERVFVAQNALDQAPIQRARETCLADSAGLSRFQSARGIDPMQTIVFVSRLEAANRIEMLIEGLTMLRRDRPAAKLVIVGGGPQLEYLQVLAQRLEQEDHVIFTGPIYDEDSLAPWMASATLFAYPVNIGLSLLHAFGYGVPVVTSDNLARQNPEIEAFIDGQTGFLFHDGDVPDMVSKWNLVMDDPALRERLSQRARQQVLETYTLENMVTGFVDALKFVAEQPEERKRV